MCEISGFSELDTDWKEAVDEKEGTAELNGSKRKVTVLHQDAKLVPSIFIQSHHGYSLQNRTMTYNSSSDARMKPLKTDGSVEVRVKGTWGGKEGPKVGGGISAGFTNNNGTYGQVEFDYNNKGEAEVDAKSGYDPDKDKSK